VGVADVTDFETMVTQIMATTRCDRAKAEAAARYNGVQPPAPDPAAIAAAARQASIDEKTEQLEVTKLFRSFGFTVRNLSQPRETKQSPGFPDLWVTHDTLPIAFWWETKRQVGGKFSDAQLTFREDAVRCGVGCGAGDRHHAAQHVIDLGLAYRDAGGVLEPVRRAS
jgi:hypothetical protein